MHHATFPDLLLGLSPYLLFLIVVPSNGRSNSDIVATAVLEDIGEVVDVQHYLSVALPLVDLVEVLVELVDARPLLVQHDSIRLTC